MVTLDWRRLGPSIGHSIGCSVDHGFKWVHDRSRGRDGAGSNDGTGSDDGAGATDRRARVSAGRCRAALVRGDQRSELRHASLLNGRLEANLRADDLSLARSHLDLGTDLASQRAPDSVLVEGGRTRVHWRRARDDRPAWSRRNAGDRGWAWLDNRSTSRTTE